MISVVLGAAITLTVASAILLIDWERLCAFVNRARGRHAYMTGRSHVNRMVDIEHLGELPGPVDLTAPGWATVCEGPGFRVVADETVNVTSKAYSNGSTQVWLKRGAA